MKKVLLIVASMACAASVFAQGTVNSQNYSGSYGAFSFSYPIYGPQAADNTLAVTSGFTGPALAGTGYTVELFGGPVGTLSGQLQPCTNATGAVWSSTTRAGNYVGLYYGQDVYVPGVAGYANAALQIRAWNNQNGTMTAWNQVNNVSGQFFGASPIFQSAALGGLDPLNPGNPANSTPALNAGAAPSSFNIHTVPEPSTIALGVIGATAFLARRRNRK